MRHTYPEIMRVKFLPPESVKDQLNASHDVPKQFNQYLQHNAEKTFYYTSFYEYLEQRYTCDDCAMCWLDVGMQKNGSVHPVAEEPMIAFIYMLKGDALCRLTGFPEFNTVAGNAYLLYVPSEAQHEVVFAKGHFTVMYFCVSKSYLENLAGENKALASILDLFDNKSPTGLIAASVPISKNALCQMWLVKQCDESKAYRESNLKARVVDLVLDYIKQSNSPLPEQTRFTQDILRHKEKIFMAAKIITEHTNGKLSIAEIAKQVGLNEQQLKKGFKDHYGQTIGKYQTDLRFERACNLLRSTDLYISEIALKTGYEDESSLIRLFKQRLNTTPQKYRTGSKNNSRNADLKFRIAN